MPRYGRILHGRSWLGRGRALEDPGAAGLGGSFARPAGPEALSGLSFEELQALLQPSGGSALAARLSEEAGLAGKGLEARRREGAKI